MRYARIFRNRKILCLVYRYTHHLGLQAPESNTMAHYNGTLFFVPFCYLTKCFISSVRDLLERLGTFHMPIRRIA